MNLKDQFARTVDGIINDVLNDKGTECTSDCEHGECILDEIIIRVRNLMSQMSIVSATIIAHRNKGMDEFDEGILKLIAKRILLDARDNIPDLSITSFDISKFPDEVKQKILASSGEETNRLIKHYAQIYNVKVDKPVANMEQPKDWEN